VVAAAAAAADAASEDDTDDNTEDGCCNILSKHGARIRAWETAATAAALIACIGDCARADI
jgi:hypothetical protein